jgi:hypothetical protein
MKKYAFLLLCFLFALVSCASDNVEPVYEPVKIEIDLSKPDAAMISATYSGSLWAFITGIELRNEAGETRRYEFLKPIRHVTNNGVFEHGSKYLEDYQIGDTVVRGAARLREFIGSGSVEARALADNEIFTFKPINIKY